MKFSKSLIATVTVVTLTATAKAQLKTDGQMEIYGRASFSVDQLNDGGTYDRTNLSSNASRLGFRGSKKLGAMTGIWQVETELQPNLGTSTPENNRLASRDTFAGLRGSFGTLRIGKFDTPFKVAREPFNLFGDQLGDMRNLTRVGDAKFDERLNNMLEYQTPVMNGLQARLAYSFHSNASATMANGMDQRDDATSISLGYRTDKLDATLAFETYGPNTTGTGKREATRAALSYKISPELRLAGFYQTADSIKTSGNVNEGASVSGVGLEYAVTTNMALKAQYMDRKAKAANASSAMYTVGAEYRHDKALRFYANYGSIDNASGINLTPWKEGRTANAAAGSNGLTKSGLSIGMRYDF